ATTVECILVVVVAPGGPTGTPGQAQTLLIYDDSINDFNTLAPIQDTDGSGFIPNTAFQAHGNTDLLNVDTTKVPNVETEVSTFDQSGTPTCSPAPGGIVTGTWHAVSTLVSQFSGTNREVLPGLTFISTGTTNSKTAITSLSVFGVSMNGPGNMGQEQN